MAVKKRPSKSALSRPRPVRRKPAAPVKAHVPFVPSPQPESAPERPYGIIVLGVIIVAALAWWSFAHRNAGQDMVQAPAAPQATPAPVVAQPAAPAPVTAVHVSHVSRHSSDIGADLLSLKALGSGKPFRALCWRADGGVASLDIFGRHNVRVASVVSSPGPQGWVELTWSGRNSKDSRVAEGRYYARPSQKGDSLVLELVVKN